MSMTPEEREAAERRADEIKAQIKFLLASEAALDERLAKWEALLSEIQQLHEKLDADETSGPLA